MRIVSIGGGPAGLYAAILLKRASPSSEVTVVERNRPDDTFGFGVVFSDATLESLALADPPSYREIERRLWHWDDIRVHVGGEVITSTGHGFCGLDRKELLSILQARCRELEVDLRFETEVDDIDAWCGGADLVLGADGVASRVREHFRDVFEPEVDVRPNRFVWLGTTYPFDAYFSAFRVTPPAVRSDPQPWVIRMAGYGPVPSGS